MIDHPKTVRYATSAYEQPSLSVFVSVCISFSPWLKLPCQLLSRTCLCLRSLYRPIASLPSITSPSHLLSLFLSSLRVACFPTPFCRLIRVSSRCWMSNRQWPAEATRAFSRCWTKNWPATAAIPASRQVRHRRESVIVILSPVASNSVQDSQIWHLGFQGGVRCRTHL